MVCFGSYSGFGRQELETTIKTKKNHQNTIFKVSLKIEVWWFFLIFRIVSVVKSSKPTFLPGFYSGFGCQEIEATVKTKKKHQNSILSDNLKIVFLFCLVFTVVLVVKSSKPVVCFISYNGFGRQELETTVKTKKNHEHSRKASKTLFKKQFWFYSGFGGQELEATVKTKKKHQNSILSDNLKIVFLFCLVFTVVLVVKSSKPVVCFGSYSGFGRQELEATVKTKKNHKEYENKHQNHCKNQKQKKHNHFQTIPRNRILVVFPDFRIVSVAKSSKPAFLPGFYTGIGGQKLEAAVQTKRNNEEPRKPQLFMVFGGFSCFFTVGLVVSTSKPL